MRLAYSTLYLFYVTTKMSLFDYITVFDVFFLNISKNKTKTSYFDDTVAI
jgi:hypothetical protein